MNLEMELSPKVNGGALLSSQDTKKRSRSKT